MANESEIRSKRNEYLAATDWTMLTDSQLDTQDFYAVQEFRRELRNITNQEGYPDNIVWPTPPEFLGLPDDIAPEVVPWWMFWRR